MLWGASFPLALASVATGHEDPARLVGRVYAANTVGGIIGAVLTSLIFLALLGTQWSQRALIGLAGVSALCALLPTTAAAGERMRVTRYAAYAVALVLVVGIGSSALIGKPSGLLVGYGRLSAVWLGHTGEFIYVGEGMNSSMAVSRLSNGVLNYHNAGKVQASSEPQDMRLQRMLGHLTTLIPAHARNVLVIGCGAGVTAGAVSISPDVEQRDDRGDRAAGAEGGVEVLRRAQLQRRRQSQGARADRRRAAFPADDEPEVRRDHVRSARPVGEGRGDALHARVLRARQEAPEPRRRGHGVRAALRERRGGGEERDGDVLRGVPERDQSGATPTTARATTWC